MADYPTKKIVDPVMPTLFDVSKFLSAEYKPYIYERKYRNNTVKDLLAGGYLKAIHPYLKDVESELLHYGKLSEGSAERAVVRVTITVAYSYTPSGAAVREMKFSALADGDAREVTDASALVRNVETRALKRAIARALGFSNVDLNAKNGAITREEEVETPLDSSVNMSSAKARKEKFEDIRDKHRSTTEPTSAQSENPEDDDF